VIGETVSHYRVLSKLGGGGMGVVYEAEDPRLGSNVALKFLPEDAARSPEALARFQREARAASALNHPHICTTHDIGEEAGRPFIVMERMRGATLKHRIEGQALPVERALELGVQMADALEAAHGAGIVHRDLKPANVFVTDRGEAKLLGFGLAKLAGSERDAFGSEVETAAQERHLTSPGTALGTVAYMSPEQARGAELDARTDLFSLGVVLYEMATGRLPFPGRTSAEIFDGILNRRPDPPSAVNPAVPASLDEVVFKALEKDRGLRYQSATDLRTDLERLRRGTGSGRLAATASLPRASGVPGVEARRRWAIALATALALAAAGLWVARRGAGKPPVPAESGPTRIVVLPFENQGAAEDGYFADGVTDEVRGKLTSLPGLQVIARGSSTPYKHTTKTPGEIARELEVRYLLTGTVRWQKEGGKSHVQVRPELVEVSGSGAPVSKWQQPFDAELTGVFQVQSDIATHVAEELGVALGAGEQGLLAETPTRNLAAYDAFLRGEEASKGLGASDPPSPRRAVSHYEHAVALDPGFALAWAQLGRARASLYFNGVPTPELARRAREAAGRAVALAPDRPDGHLALGAYQHTVAHDNRRALEHYYEAERRGPPSADLLSTKAVIEESLGRWEAAVQHLRQAERIDPRSVLTQRRLGVALLRLRRASEARSALDRGLALSPANLALIELKAMTFLSEGDLAAARAVLAAAPRELEPGSLVAFVAYYNDLVWVLDGAQRELLLRLPPSAFGGGEGGWRICIAQARALQGDGAGARLHADAARRAYQEELRAAPRDPQRHLFLGLALAYAGRKEEAVRVAERGRSLLPTTEDAVSGPYNQHQLARVYVVVGEPEKALDQLEALLRVPYYLTPAWLKIDPNLDKKLSRATNRVARGPAEVPAAGSLPPACLASTDSGHATSAGSVTGVTRRARALH
jgi:TolB-like protein/Flp pilus assembly protein TadD